MSIDLIFSPSQPNNPFEIARRELISSLAKLPVPALDSFPVPEQFEDVNEHIRAVAAVADQWLKTVGGEVASNSTVRTNRDLFDGMFASAVDGWATFECQRAAEALREECVA